MITLHAQTWQQARNQWGWLQNGLQAIIDRTHERWMPLDVWSALRASTAFLHTIRKDDDDIGFLILQQETDPDGPVLFIWACWAEPGSLMPDRAEFYERLAEVGLRIGAKRIRMKSPRGAWDLVGFLEPVAQIYEAEL